MNWVLQFSVAFHLLNNAALLAVGTLGYCALRRRVEDRLPPWALSLVYGALFGCLSILTSLAPLTSVPPVCLRFVPLAVVTLFCGVPAGAVATLLLIASSVFALNDDPKLGVSYIAFVDFAVAAGYRLLLRARKQEPHLGDLLIAGVGTVLAILATVAWLWGLQQFE
ncbi:MAG TPA: hypothetical protein VK433_03070, partial [Stellaceae bacterium]|nr:hypothetical protein [Stellaceae bacterium]